MNLWLCWGSTAHGVKFMKMHQFAFVQKCPALTSTALPPPSPLNVQLTLSGEKVNMSMAPYPISDVGLLILIWWSGSYQRNVPYDIFATLCRAVPWKYEKYLCTIGRVRRVSFFLLDSTGVLKKLCCGGYKRNNAYFKNNNQYTQRMQRYLFYLSPPVHLRNQAFRV